MKSWLKKYGNHILTCLHLRKPVYNSIMNIIRNILALIGAAVMVLWITGSFGIGNFTFIYGPEKVVYLKEPK